MQNAVESLRELLTLDELTNRVGMSVRTIRFYTSRGLVPPPIRRGRSGYYSAEHVARLELVQELQSHGLTLSAIEKYVASIPESASSGDVALHRTMLAPWMSEQPVQMSRDELERRAGRSLDEGDLETLEAIGVVQRGEEEGGPEGPCDYRVAVSQLSVGLGLLELGYPTEAARAATAMYARHGREIADELFELFRTMVWPKYKESGMSPERLTEIVEQLKPLSVASLVSAYEAAMDERQRENIARRAR